MLKTLFPAVLLAWFLTSCAPKTAPVATPAPPEKSTDIPVPVEYKGSYTRFADLIHTSLDLKFDWKKRSIRGKAEVTLRPHFYPVDSIALDAKGMEIYSVSTSRDGRPVSSRYEYNGRQLTLYFENKLTRKDTILVVVDYLSKPEEIRKQDNPAHQGEIGFYFIDPDSLDPERPTQFWTQGETESNSIWFPTIESPAQKFTQDIRLTVDTAFETLSNGLLVTSVNNGDGTKTDHWRQSIPHAPYLTMIAAGNWTVKKLKWKEIELSYYTDAEYSEQAEMIFGKTPQMMDCFEELLGMEYQWEKYAQVPVHDYISGAMENSSAVIYGSFVQQLPGDFVDGNYEDYVSHELFHHWFGNVVTCESWSNITLNEGFANYSQYLWREYAYGREDADQLNYVDQSTYLYLTSENDPPLVRYQYEKPDDLYDVISYHKGGRVLHMLRKYTGDEAFFEAIKKYLHRFKFSSAEADNLRQVFEDVTGEDLNWFFNQWFFQGGKPSLEISYLWDDTLKEQKVIVKQVQDFGKNPLYRLPVDVDFYFDKEVMRKRITVERATEEFAFYFSSRPLFVNFDAENMLLCTKKEWKTEAEAISQYRRAPLFLDRHEAITKLGISYSAGSEVAKVMTEALNDRTHYVRRLALNNIGEIAKNDPDAVKEKMISLALDDSVASVRELACRKLSEYFPFAEMKDLYLKKLDDISFDVKAACFNIIALKDTALAFRLAEDLEKVPGSAVMKAVTGFYAEHSHNDKTDFFLQALYTSKSRERYDVIKNFEKYLLRQDHKVMQKGISHLVQFASHTLSKRNADAVLKSMKNIEAGLQTAIDDLTGKNGDQQPLALLLDDLRKEITTLEARKF